METRKNFEGELPFTKGRVTPFPCKTINHATPTKPFQEQLNLQKKRGINITSRCNPAVELSRDVSSQLGSLGVTH